MSYQTCCCSQLSTILGKEVRTLWSTSYQSCIAYGTQATRRCAGWTWWLKWICVLWQYIIVTVCLTWVTVTNLFWTFNATLSAGTCWISGVSFAIWSLNNILRQNLAHSLSLGFGVNTPTNPVSKAGWNLTFNDEFNGTSLDTTKWYTRPNEYPNPFPGGNPPPLYWDASAIQPSSGTIKLQIEKDPKTFTVNTWQGPTSQTVTIDHKVGYLVAKKTEPWGEKLFLQRFGYFETRCRMPRSKATWPAFWMWGGMDWPPEIDVFEVLTSISYSSFSSNYHWGAAGQCFDHDDAAATHPVNNITSDFHIYGCEWDSCFIKWYYDNLLVRVAHDHVNNVFEPMRVLITNGIDTLNNASNFAQLLTLPASFEIDYVRVYEKP